MSLDPPADDPELDIGVRSFFLSDDDLSDDDDYDDGEVVSTLMVPNHQVSGPTAPLPSNMVSTAPQGDPYQQTRDALTDVVTRLHQTEQALSQHGSLSVPAPIPMPTRRPIHRPFGQPAPNNEPPYPNQPANWDEHHEYFLWACRGAVPIITDHLQAIFQFSPPLLRSFVRAKLNNNAKRQFEFLQASLTRCSVQRLALFCGRRALTTQKRKRAASAWIFRNSVRQTAGTQSLGCPGVSPLLPTGYRCMTAISSCSWVTILMSFCGSLVGCSTASQLIISFLSGWLSCRF